MDLISNTLTELLNSKLITEDEIEMFIDNLEDEIFGMSTKDFYIKYKGDIKELLGDYSEEISEFNFERQILSALQRYYKQRCFNPNMD